MKLERHIFHAHFMGGLLVHAATSSQQAAQTPTTLHPVPSICSEGASITNLWLVERLNVSYTDDELVRPGNASWTLTNTMLNTTERLTCPLRANYVCEMDGTPQDKGLYIWLQINLDEARFTFNESLSCGDAADSR